MNDRYGFICITKDFDVKDGRYRQGFDKYIQLPSNEFSYDDVQ